MQANVSIIIPTFNCQAFVGEAVNSALVQTRPPAEVIVIDDGSTDRTKEVLSDFGRAIRYVKQPNGGVAVARNKGLELATADWVLFLDADDRLPPTALDDLLRHTGTDPDSVVYGDRLNISETGAVLGEWRSRDCTGPPPAAARANFGAAAFSPGCALVPRSLALGVGGFHPDPALAGCEDRHFWIRCGARAPFVYCGRVVYHYRDRPGSLSKDHARHVVARVRAQIDALHWCGQRGIRLFETEPNAADLLSRMLHNVYYARRWKSVVSLLALARELHLDNATIRRIRTRNRLPRWVIEGRDWLATLWTGKV